MTRRGWLGLPALLLPGVARAQQHWLVGRWRGVSQGEGGESGRSLTVTAVQGDSVSASWGGQPVAATLSNDTLRFATANGNNPVVLRRVAPDRLEGTVGTRGGAGPVRALVFTRQ